MVWTFDLCLVKFRINLLMKLKSITEDEVVEQATSLSEQEKKLPTLIQGYESRPLYFLK